MEWVITSAVRRRNAQGLPSSSHQNLSDGGVHTDDLAIVIKERSA